MNVAYTLLSLDNLHDKNVENLLEVPITSGCPQTSGYTEVAVPKTFETQSPGHRLQQCVNRNVPGMAVVSANMDNSLPPPRTNEPLVTSNIRNPSVTPSLIIPSIDNPPNVHNLIPATERHCTL